MRVTARMQISALIVTVTPQDFPDASYMGGVAFQRRLEQAAYRAGNSKIPLQLFGDFKEGRISTGLGEVKPCTKGAYAFADLNQVLPKPLTEALCEAIPAFDRKIHGFAREDALLLGVESRTSSPLRMVRDEMERAMCVDYIRAVKEQAMQAASHQQRWMAFVQQSGLQRVFCP